MQSGQIPAAGGARLKVNAAGATQAAGIAGTIEESTLIIGSRESHRQENGLDASVTGNFAAADGDSQAQPRMHIWQLMEITAAEYS